MAPNEQELVVIQTVEHNESAHPYFPRSASRHVSFISITLAHSLTVFSKIRLVILDHYSSERSPRSKAVHRVVNRRLLDLLGSAPHHYIPEKIKVLDELKADVSKPTETCELVLTLTEDESGAIATLTPFSGRSCPIRNEPGRIVFDELYRYLPGRPIFTAIESAFALSPGTYWADRYTHPPVTSRFYILPMEPSPLLYEQARTDSRTISIASLPDNVLSSIGRHILRKSEWPPGLFSLLLVTRRFYGVILPVLYSSIGKGYGLQCRYRNRQIKLSETLKQNPHLRSFVTHFESSEFMAVTVFPYHISGIVGFQDLFTNTTHLAHLSISFKLFQLVRDQLNLLLGLKGFLLKIEDHDFESSINLLDIYATLSRWSQLKTLVIEQDSTLSDGYECEGDRHQILTNGLTELGLRDGIVMGTRLQSLLGSSLTSLRILRLRGPEGLTNADIYGALSAVGPNLISLEICLRLAYEDCSASESDSQEDESDSDSAHSEEETVTTWGDSKEEMAVDRTLHLMRRLRFLHVSATVATPGCIARIPMGSLHSSVMFSMVVEPWFEVYNDSGRVPSYEWELETLAAHLGLIPPKEVWCRLEIDRRRYELERRPLQVVEVKRLAFKAGIDLAFNSEKRMESGIEDSWRGFRTK